ncbi:PAN/Apple domain [Trinorchestia longiramus]|nr:PAN/Apple domain [Trinorchestia longiramus]
MDSSCKTASYDAIADHCFMTDGRPDTVITQPLVGSVAFFKFREWNLYLNLYQAIDRLQMKLLLLQLFTAALVPAAAVYQTLIKDTAIHSPISKRIDVMTECECRAKCDMDSSCKAASYDAIADHCFMTDGGRDSVITQPLVGSIAFFKFQFEETPLEVFLTENTNNGSVARLRELCAKENRIPLIIKTEQVKEAALKLVRESQNTNIQLERTVSLSTPTLESVGPWGLEPECQLSPTEPRSILILSSVCRTPVAKGTDDPCSQAADSRPWAPTSSCR